MKRKNQWVLFAVLLLALISLSPGEDSTLTLHDRQGGTGFVPQPKQKTEKEAGDIKVAVSMEPGEFERLKETSRQFMEKHQLEVELVNIIEKEAYQTFKESLELGEAPDVLLLDNAWVREFASKGYLLPVESYYSGQAGVDSLSTSLSENSWNGYLWGVPKDYDPYVIVYQPAKLQELGFKQLPQSSNEWAALLAGFEKNNHIADWAALNTHDAYADISLIWRMGLNPNGKKDEDFAMHAGIKTAFSQIEKLRKRFYPVAYSGDNDHIWSRLEQGQVLLYVTRASSFDPVKRSSLKMEFPSSQSGVRMLWLKGRSYSLTSQSQHAKTANAWIQEVTSSEEQAIAYTRERKLPATKNLYRDSRLKGLQEWISAIQLRGKAGYLPVDARLPDYLEHFAKDASAYLNGSGDLKSFMISYERIGQAARP